MSGDNTENMVVRVQAALEYFAICHSRYTGSLLWYLKYFTITTAGVVACVLRVMFANIHKMMDPKTPCEICLIKYGKNEKNKY